MKKWGSETDHIGKERSYSLHYQFYKCLSRFLTQEIYSRIVDQKIVTLPFLRDSFEIHVVDEFFHIRLIWNYGTLAMV